MDALRVLSEDQMLISELLHEARAAEKPGEKRLLFSDALNLLEDHLDCAEGYLYSRVHENSDDLASIVNQQLESHEKIRSFARKLVRNRDDRDFSSQLEKFSQRAERLFEREEHQVFPAIWKTLTDLQLLQMGMEIQLAREPALFQAGDLDDAA